MTLEERLRFYHKGETNAVKSSVLEKIYQCTGGEIRKEINELRCKGVPICSTRQGYFYAASTVEIDKTIAQLSSRINKIMDAKSGMTKSLERRGTCG